MHLALPARLSALNVLHITKPHSGSQYYSLCFTFQSSPHHTLFMSLLVRLVETCVVEDDRGAVMDALKNHVTKTGQPDFKRPSKVRLHADTVGISALSNNLSDVVSTSSGRDVQKRGSLTRAEKFLLLGESPATHGDAGRYSFSSS